MPGYGKPDLLYSLRVYAANSSSHWQKTELRMLSSLSQVKEPFCEVNTHIDPYLIEYFGSNTPPASHYLLHSAPGWDSNFRPVPVLLVHGAGLDATSYTNLWNMGHVGLQQQLVELGYRVFAITFSHPHGDNYIQAQQLADAVQQVCSRCGVQKVDLVVHSKGGIAARIYLSSLISPAFRGDVRRLIMLGVPNLGNDFAFRFPSISYMIYLAGGNGVIAWDRLYCWGSPIDVTLRSIYTGGAFPGQSQILYRWDEQIPLDITQQDWWTTYYGGKGFMSHSRGIDAALADGGYLIEHLERRGLEPDIELSVLGGTSCLFGMIPLPGGAESDGVVFLDSVFNTEAMVKRGARLKEKQALPLNHIELLYHPQAARWVHQQLSDGY
jgi:triacylglycerol lipase